MNSDAAAEKILTFLRSHPAYSGQLPADLSPSFSLTGAGVLDSVGIFHLIIFLEQEFKFNVEVPEIREDNFETLHAITEFVLRKISPATDVYAG